MPSRNKEKEKALLKRERVNNRERKGEGRLNRNIKIEEEQWYFPKLDGEENIISCTSICKFKLPQYEMYIQMRS